MKKIIMMLKSLSIASVVTLNVVACSAENGKKIEIDFTDPSANTSESKDTIKGQIIYPLMQTLNIPNIKFSNGVKWTQTQINNSLWGQKEILKSSFKSKMWADFFDSYITTEDHAFSKVEIPWKLENTGSLGGENGDKKEKKIAVVSELNLIIDLLNDEKHEDYVKTNSEYEKANNFALVKLKNSSYILTIIYNGKFKFNVELKNLTASLERRKYKEKDIEKWEWFFTGYQFRRYDIFPMGKDYIVTKDYQLHRPSLSEFNFPFADLELSIVSDSIEKIN